MRIGGPIDTSQAESGSSSRMGGGRGVAMGGGGVGIVGVIIYVLINVLGGGTGGSGINTGLGNAPAGTDRQATQDLKCPTGSDKTDPRCLATGVMNDVQDHWAKKFQAAGKSYRPTLIHFFDSAVDTGCGSATADTGPFYCPADRLVYLDVTFYDELKTRFGAAGDFAQAYVVAHEVGHHVQTLLGIEPQVRKLQQQDASRTNELSVRMELQADCLAGVWAHDTNADTDHSGVDLQIEPGDIDEALNAATAIGDDRLQKQARGSVDPDTFTHGTSAQRMKWFKTGFTNGTVESCDTFNTDV
jgi:predicted metalloprotease